MMQFIVQSLIYVFTECMKVTCDLSSVNHHREERGAQQVIGCGCFFVCMITSCLQEHGQ